MTKPIHTPGPWRWELNERSRQIQLCGGVPQFDLIVMDFVRWGMNGAAVRLREPVRELNNVMYRADKWGAEVPQRAHHADWFKAIKHPDAQLIESAPDLLATVKHLIWLVESECKIDGGHIVKDAKAVVARIEAAS